MIQLSERNQWGREGSTSIKGASNGSCVIGLSFGLFVVFSAPRTLAGSSSGMGEVLIKSVEYDYVIKYYSHFNWLVRSQALTTLARNGGPHTCHLYLGETFRFLNFIMKQAVWCLIIFICLNVRDITEIGYILMFLRVTYPKIVFSISK